MTMSIKVNKQPIGCLLSSKYTTWMLLEFQKNIHTQEFNAINKAISSIEFRSHELFPKYLS